MLFAEASLDFIHLLDALETTKMDNKPESALLVSYHAKNSNHKEIFRERKNIYVGS